MDKFFSKINHIDKKFSQSSSHVVQELLKILKENRHSIRKSRLFSSCSSFWITPISYLLQVSESPMSLSAFFILHLSMWICFQLLIAVAFPLLNCQRLFFDPFQKIDGFCHSFSYRLAWNAKNVCIRGDRETSKANTTIGL